MKSLKDILYKTAIVSATGSMSKSIGSIYFDSREVKKGGLFIAIKGTQVDGHTFIEEVIKRGAIAIVCETMPENLKDKITYVQVRNSSDSLGQIASNFYDNPSEELKLIGVTGTNGKTTIAKLLYDLFSLLGYSTGLLSTIENKIVDKIISATHTTPDAIQINYLLREMINSGCDYCFMEVSSHAISQNRINGLTFRGGIFTNLTHDHLDYHKTFAEYLKVKKSFFDTLRPEAFALTNIDDKNGTVMFQNTKALKHTYSLKAMSDFRCKILENQFYGLQLRIDNNDVWCRLVGEFNAYNLLAVYATATILGENTTEILTSLSMLGTVKGRFEIFKSKNNITAIVDYAHTPDALKNILETITSIRTSNEQLITVFGAGGNRDKGKRPLMGEIAANNSNIVILTSDNPRFEDPEVIIEEIKKGLSPLHFKKVIAITKREEAIKTACTMAKPGDIILIAGKGHETYQEVLTPFRSSWGTEIYHPFKTSHINPFSQSRSL